jgi:GTPase SAR1 family protein
VFRDTAGQRNFRTIGRGYYTSTKAFVLVYDVTNIESFRLIEQFSQMIEQVRLVFLPTVLDGQSISFSSDWIGSGTTLSNSE